MAGEVQRVWKTPQRSTAQESENRMLRWIGILSVLSLLTGLLTSGAIPNEAFGLTRILFGVFTALLAGSLVIGIFRR